MRDGYAEPTRLQLLQSLDAKHAADMGHRHAEVTEGTERAPRERSTGARAVELLAFMARALLLGALFAGTAYAVGLLLR